MPGGPDDATLLTPAELRTELSIRGLTPTNFREDDIAQLQPVLNAEYAEKRKDAAQLAEQERLAALAAELERVAIEAKFEAARAAQAADDADPETAVWLKQVRFPFAQCRARTLSRALDRAHDRSPLPARSILILQIAANETDPQAVLRPSTVHVKRLISELAANTSLLSLDLQRASLDDALTELLADALTTNTALLSLDLSTNAVGPRGCTALAGMLQKNRTLRTLTLDHNPLSVAVSAQVRDFSGVEALSAALARNTTLKTLSLFKCGIGARGGEALANALGAADSESGLVDLNLFYNNVHAEATATLQKVIEASKAHELGVMKRRKDSRAETKAIEDDLAEVEQKRTEAQAVAEEIAANRVKRANARALAALNARAAERQKRVDEEEAIRAAEEAAGSKKKKKKKKKKK